ncbi:MAG: DUF3786 domain-containing protein [Nitrospirae bacterium]|nr:DUF3786 domain-containing protein [Nitrospirota bacterium]
MELVPIKIEHGEEKAWEKICGLSRAELCGKTGAAFDKKTGAFRLRCFGIDFHINPCEMRISAVSEKGDLFLGRLKDFFRLSILWYMNSAMDIPQSGRLLRPEDIKGGHKFTVGTHVLPLDEIARKYAKDPEGFIAKGQEYGAEVITGYGNACIRLYPLPRVPVTIILWLEDEEFPAKADLLFDSTCEFQLALSDIVWAVAMMCSLVMFEG